MGLGILKLYLGQSLITILDRLCPCVRPCYNPVTEIEMIQQGDYLWKLDGSLTPDSKQQITKNNL